MRIWLEDFRFSGDLFYQQETHVPFRKGVTLFRGINHDAIPENCKNPNDYSNGTSKSRLPQLLGAFIYGASDLGNFKKLVLPHFKGTLQFRNLHTNTHWSFSLDLKENAWDVLKDGQQYPHFHKPSDYQNLLIEEIGLSRKDWSNFVYVNRNSLTTLINKDHAERRKYLESFFNIDEFYEEKRKEYVKNKEELEEQLHALEHTKARLSQVLESLSHLEGIGYLDNQIELIQATLSMVTKEQAGKYLRLNTVLTQLKLWSEYYSVCLLVQGKEPLNDLKTWSSDIRNALADLKEKQRRRVQVETKVRLELTPVDTLLAGYAFPEIPEVVEPKNQEISQLGILISQMQAKSKLVEKFKTLKTTLPEALQETEKELIETRKQIVETQAEIRLHISLVKSGDSCTKCGQSLAFILNKQDPAAKLSHLQIEEKALTDALTKLDSSLAIFRHRQSILDQMRSLREQIEAYGVFGRTTADAENELKNLKMAETQWRTYCQAKQQHEARLQKKDLLLAELKGLGYPSILEIDQSKNIESLSEKLVEVEADVSLLQKHQDLLNKVIDFTPEADLKVEESELKEDTSFNEDRSKALSKLFGEFSSQRQMVEQLTATKKLLELELEPAEALHEEYQLLEAMVKFFSPTGFKLYELRKRCELLIERANFWSPVFFQEQYEWSLPNDLESINFLVQPVKHRSTAPYPASNLSAGEENRAEKVLLFAQLDMTKPEKTINALFLDEIEGYLDARGKLVFTEIVIPKLKETFLDRCMVVISHEDSLRDSPDIDHLWLAERKDRQTSLKVIENYTRIK